jgi:hypothetical protein
MFLLWNGRPRWHLLIIPVIWTLIGTSAAFMLGVPQDLGLPLAGIAAITLLYTGRASEPDTESTEDTGKKDQPQGLGGTGTYHP